MTDFQAVRQAVDLEAIALQYTNLSRSRNGPCPLCGGRDRFYIHKGGQRWGCRSCTPQGADVIELVSRVENITTAEAARQLIGQSFRTARPNPHPPRQASENAWSTDAWQREAQAAISAAKIPPRASSPAAAYLRARGIESVTWEAYSIGATIRAGRPAMLLPWLDARGCCTALKYRFTDDLATSDKSKRFTQKTGSNAIIFGAQLVTGESNTLIVVEGEFNGLSIWQAARSQGWDVVSPGPERNSAGLACLLRLIERNRYAHIVAWFDNADRALAAAGALPGAIPMRSPKGLDANDLLVTYGAPSLVELLQRIVAGNG